MKGKENVLKIFVIQMHRDTSNRYSYRTIGTGLEELRKKIIYSCETIVEEDWKTLCQ